MRAFTVLDSLVVALNTVCFDIVEFEITLSDFDKLEHDKIKIRFAVIFSLQIHCLNLW